MRLLDLLLKFKRGIAFATALILIENIAWIVEPAVFGTVIDALIARAGDEPAAHTSYPIPLIIWIFVFLVNSGTGVIRRVVDQKIFLAMFTQLAMEISQLARKRRFGVSKTAALAQLSEQFTSFFQYRVPDIIEQVISIGGAVIALAAFDWRISLACSSLIIPLLVIREVYSRKVIGLQKDVHDTFEDTYDVFSSQKPEEIQAYYAKTSVFKQRIANWGALNFGVIRGALLIIFLVVLYIAIDLDDFSTGNIYSIVAYIWTFVTSSEYLPELMESWTSLKDITRRLQEEAI
jgi:ABC-type multidrug transport system fused ATPase/permease subunit